VLNDSDAIARPHHKRIEYDRKADPRLVQVSRSFERYGQREDRSSSPVSQATETELRSRRLTRSNPSRTLLSILDAWIARVKSSIASSGSTCMFAADRNPTRLSRLSGPSFPALCRFDLSPGVTSFT